MSDKVENPTAFPNDGGPGSEGMTLRDYFAGQAMQSMIARGEDDGGFTAQSAYRFAEAMLQERTNPNELK